jgi:hypothetical protein
MKASGKPDPALARWPIGRLTETRNIQTAGGLFFYRATRYRRIEIFPQCAEDRGEIAARFTALTPANNRPSI